MCRNGANLKISFKFFFAAYITALLAAGLMGIILINNMTSVLWETRTSAVCSAETFAADSLSSFTDLKTGTLTGIERADAARQILPQLDTCINDLKILLPDESEYTLPELNKGINYFKRSSNILTMYSVCQINANGENYVIMVSSDFTEIENRCRLLWLFYCVAVLILALLSGLCLYLLSRHLTAPLKGLTSAAKEVAKGDYGLTVKASGNSTEIDELAKSFNIMSTTIDQKINEIREETKKRDIFVSDFTHELKTPMTAIIGYSQMLASYSLSESELKSSANAINSEAKRLEALSRNLLELYIYRNETIELKPVSLKSIKNELNTTLRFSAEKYNVMLSIELGSEIVSANHELLISLICNLTDNAFKACYENGKVNIYSTAENGYITISVSDNGRGIAPENIKYLTEPFYREDKARSRRLGGAGLGLALCSEIAALHKTKLEFKSERGKGTTVSFKLIQL